MPLCLKKLDASVSLLVQDLYSEIQHRPAAGASSIDQRSIPDTAVNVPEPKAAASLVPVIKKRKVQRAQMGAGYVFQFGRVHLLTTTVEKPNLELNWVNHLLYGILILPKSLVDE